MEVSMQLSNKRQTTTTTTVQEIQQVVKKKVTVTDKFKGFRNCTISYDKRIKAWRMLQI